MSKGTVKWFNNQKGYGFICDEQGNDVFVHYSGLEMEGYKTLEEGASVQFEVTEGAKGPQAIHVTTVTHQILQTVLRLLRRSGICHPAHIPPAHLQNAS